MAFAAALRRGLPSGDDAAARAAAPEGDWLGCLEAAVSADLATFSDRADAAAFAGAADFSRTILYLLSARIDYSGCGGAGEFAQELDGCRLPCGDASVFAAGNVLLLRS